MAMKLLHKLQHSLDFWFLLVTSFVFFLSRLPSFFEPYWYGDEGVYEVLGFGMRHGRLLYQGIWDNKPPLLYLIYALFDGNQPYVRFFSFLVGLAAMYFFFMLSKKLFENKKAVYLATAFFALFLGLPLVEGNIANAENFMVLPAVVSLYLLVKSVQEKKYSFITLFSIGLLLGIPFLIKIVAVFDFAALLVILGFVVLSWSRKAVTSYVRKSLIMSAGFLLPLLATVGFFVSKGMLKVFIQSAFLSNVGYVNYGNQFIIPQGFLILKLLLLSVVILILLVKRRSFSFTQQVVYIVTALSLFNAFFSGRPYTHYMLVLLTAMSLLAGLILERKWRIVNAILLILLTVILYKNFWFYGKTTAYYRNFVQFTTGTKTVSEYQSFFDKGVPRDYAIATFLSLPMNTNKSVFLWTNSAQIHYLIQKLPLGRYTTAYHMTANPSTLQETALALSKSSPDFVVILPNAPEFPFHMTNYRLRETIEGGLIYEKIF